MKSFSEISQIINSYHKLGETIQAANFLTEEYGIKHPNLERFELREKAIPECILITIEMTFGKKQIIRIPKNTFEFPIVLMLNRIAHVMIHASQKVEENFYPDRNKRKWQAYFEMLLNKTYPQIPVASVFHQKFFTEKALNYKKTMGENSQLQLKYASQ